MKALCERPFYYKS